MSRTSAAQGRGAQSSRFANVPGPEIQRSTFNRSHSIKTAFDCGYLVPFFADEMYPGDTFNLNTTLMGRLATPIVPVLDNMYLETFYFFVPNRLLWSNWEKFMGAQDNPGDSTDYLIPQVESGNTGFAEESLFDYFGLPPGVEMSVNALYSRAYNLCFNEWFRDENLQNSLTVDLGDGPDSPANYVLKKRGKRKDYFTSALPWPQKGPAVTLPLGSRAPVYGQGLFNDVGTIVDYPIWEGLSATDSKTSKWATEVSADFITALGSAKPSLLTWGLGTKAQHEADPFAAPPYADLTDATASTVNALRQAFQVQRLLERDARGGTRYIESNLAHFGVRSSDARLQRPEFLGGNRTPITFSPVPQTSATDGTVSPQGNLAAFGTVHSGGNGFNYSSEEHGVVIGLMCVFADLNYQQGINRMWSRQTRWDYYYPALAHLGEQTILNKEIYAQGTNADDEAFGYQERWAELRYKPSNITGKMRSQSATSLDVWHLAQEFNSLPTLNSEFIEEDVPYKDRISAVSSEPDIILDGFLKYKCARPLPTYSVPGLVDHF